MGLECVFGYGSLSAEAHERPLAVATLRGHQRVWAVAMDNLASIPGYKFYVDPVTGERPAVFVTFLTVEPAAVDCVGFLLPLESASQLAALDRRERNYDRVDVTELIQIDGTDGPGAVPARVWTYLGTPAARERYAAAAARGQAVIQADYIAGVQRAFSLRGLASEFRASTRPPECPVRPLTRVNDSSRV